MPETTRHFGNILKRETMASASLSWKPEVLVLAIKDPYPGYYCSEEMPADNSCKEESCYLPMIPERNREDQLCRISLEMQESLDVNVCPACISLEEKTVEALRIKNAGEKEFTEVIEFCKQAGVQFMKPKNIKAFLSRINLRYFFELSHLAEGIYQNVQSTDHYYFEIPQSLAWPLFEKLITFQKSDTVFRNFDGALGYWIQKPRFIDFVRVYGRELNTENLEGIRIDFLHVLSEYTEGRLLL